MPKKGYKQTIKHREKISERLKNSKVENGITYCAEYHLKSGLHVLVQKES